jgi:hypothetical protein
VIYSDGSSGHSSSDDDNTFVVVVVVIILIGICVWYVAKNHRTIYARMTNASTSDVTEPLLDKASSSSSNSTVSSTFSVDSHSWLPSLYEAQVPYDQTFVVTAEF